MKNLSMREFKDMCESKSLSTFIFSSDNQCLNITGVKFNIVFTSVAILFNPDIIFFKDCNNNYLRLDIVNGVEISEEGSLLGEVFTVVCGDLSNRGRDVSYTFIAR